MSSASTEAQRYSAKLEAGSLTIPQLVTLKELSTLLSLSVSTLSKWVMDNRVPHYKLGRAVRFNPEEVSAWLAKRKV